MTRPNRRQALAGAGAALLTSNAAFAQYPERKPRSRILILAERASGDHQAFVDAGKAYIAKIAPQFDIAFDSITSTSPLRLGFHSGPIAGSTSQRHWNSRQTPGRVS